MDLRSGFFLPLFSLLNNWPSRRSFIFFPIKISGSFHVFVKEGFMVSICFNIGIVIQGSKEMKSGVQIKLEWISMGV